MGRVSQIQLGSQEGGGTKQAPVIFVRNLKVAFTRSVGMFGNRASVIKAVDNVSFDVYESEMLSIVGESGSGKTTVARCLLALTRPTSGSIQYKGQEVPKLAGRKLLDYRRDVQMIFQDPFESLNSRQDVFTAISTPMWRLRGVKSYDRLVEEVSNLLREVQLDPDEVMSRFPHQLSGGQRQRVNIARALAPNPKVLIADEPITMLDAAQRMNILSLLYELKSKRNLTIVMITHDLASAKVSSDRTIVMYLGKVVELGPTDSVLSRPYHPYVELILSSTPNLKPFTKHTEEVTTTTQDDGVEIRQGCNFSPRCKYATEECRQKEPELLERSSARYVACYNPLNSAEQN